MQDYELIPQYDSRKSFYGKARVRNNDGDLELISYSTRVAVIHQATEADPKSASVYGLYSQTTLRHIKELLKQNGFKADNAKQIMADYSPLPLDEHIARERRLGKDLELPEGGMR